MCNTSIAGLHEVKAEEACCGYTTEVGGSKPPLAIKARWRRGSAPVETHRRSEDRNLPPLTYLLHN